ncbi:MAG: hypothetical protein RTU30_05805 [Candidatus Thorarchaeota archaeon]
MRRRNLSPAILSSLFLLLCVTLGAVPSSTTELKFTSITKEQVRNEEDAIELSWISNNDQAPKPFTNDSVCTGDHIVLNATFSDSSVTTCEMTLSRGFTFETTRELVVPAANYTPFFALIEFDQLDWVVVEGIREFDVVNVTGYSHGIDSDFMIWWADTDNETWDYTSNLVAERMATGEPVESSTFIADRDGAIVVACFDFSVVPGNYTLIVSTLVEHIETSQGSTVHYDTYGYYPFNVTLNLIVTGHTDANTSFSQYIENITLNNYFTPTVEDIHVESERSVHSISWTVNDRNVLDTHFFEITVSSDSGLSYQLLTVNLYNTSYIWDSSMFDNGFYIIQVRAFDDLGFVGVGVSESFEGGPWSPALISLSVISSDSFQYEEGEVGNWVWWLPSCNYSLSYSVSIDSDIVETETWSSGTIAVSADGLTVGRYEYLIVLFFDEYNTLNHSVYVTVIEPTNSTFTISEPSTIETSSKTTTTHTTPHTATINTTRSDWTSFLQSVQVITTLTSGIVIVVFSVLLVRWRFRSTIQGSYS